MSDIILSDVSNPIVIEFRTINPIIKFCTEFAFYELFNFFPIHFSQELLFKIFNLFN